MLFRRKGALANAAILLIFFATSHGQTQNQGNARSYDTNDWIPVSRPAASSEGSQVEATQKRPTGRVLNLPLQDEKRFFSLEQSPPSQQQLLQNQRQLQPQPTYIPNGQPQILLPPQLQNLIAQGQSYISPQKLNHQLLPPQTQDYPVLPTQSFPVNATDFNSPDVIQNINLGLYNQQPIKQQAPQHNNEQPEVQLLYVPLENLQRQRGQRQKQVVFPTEQAVVQPQVYNPPIQQQQQQYQQQHHQQQHQQQQHQQQQHRQQQQPQQQQQYQNPTQHKQVQLQNIEQEFVQQALQAQKLQEQFQHNVQPVTQQSYRRPFPEVVQQPQTSAAPKKRKPHQPPLAVYMGTGQQEIKIGDVLTILKDAKTISVQDTINPDSPQVFVGPSHLEPPEGYAKFDLPYLSNIDNNRVERKVEQLPFFVAPLSYKAPPGYSKIPFPSPHVGSVVINHAKATPSTTTEHTNFVNSQILDETTSHIPFSHSEVSTVRTTRGRQRQPTRNNYSSSTVQTPVSDEIPYGPLPTGIIPEVQQPHSVPDIISPNPYGPTRFVQSTTPAIYNKDVNIPEEIFSTKNRFSTTSPNYNNYNAQNIPPKQNQYRPEVISTEPTIASSTLSGNLANDKYTVLEQFPIRQKQNEETVPQRGSNRQHSRRPTQEPYRTDSAERTALPLISSSHISNQQEDYERQSPFKQQYIQEYNQQNYDDVPTRQTYREPPKQRVTESYQETPSRQHVTESYQETPRQRITESHQETPSRQRVTESYQEIPRQRVTESYQETPTRQRIPENYQHVTQSAPIRQSTQKEIQSSNEDYDEPAHHVRGQQYSSENYDRNSQFTSQPQTPRTRGRQHFTPENYVHEEYEQVKDKTTEPFVSVTKEPIIEYNLPIEHINYQISEQHRPQIQNPYLQDEPHEDVISSKQEYTLPSKLPAISPQLPGLINSLQDQQIRPLLAPLLLPISEEPPVEESIPDNSEEYYSSPEPEAIHIPVPTTTTTTTTTTTPAPTETTTQYKRTRSRQRGTRPTVSYDYVSSTTDIPRRTSQYRGRRPYNGQPRQEYKPRENYSVSSTFHPEIVEATTRTIINRNRQAPQRQYISSTTEQPRRNTPSSRQRFRTRGRPVKSEEEYIERSTQDNIPVFKQPQLEGGFQASAPLLQENVQLTVPTSSLETREEPVVSQRPQKEQALIYVQNTNKPILEEASPVYIPRQQYVSSTEAVEPLHHSTISATGPDNNFVPDVQDQPTVLSTQQQIKYSNPTETNLNLPEENSEETNVQVPHIRHNLEPVRTESPTTEAIRSRTRIRGKTRRINPVASSPSPRYQPSYTSSTTQKTTTEAKQEEEFYGFFRQPNFGKPPQTEPPKPEFVASTPVPSPRPNFVYLSRSTEEPQQHRIYVNSDRSLPVSTPKPYLPVTRVHDSHVEPNIQVQRQYISSTAAPSSSVEPVTRRPIVRTRRPVNSPVRVAESSSTSDQSHERYYARPSKRPEVQTSRPTRIRGRIRKPTHPATVQSVQSHSRSNELENNSEEYVPRQRVINRGKSHFQSPKSDKVTEEPEEENYPVNFLQNHGVQHSSPSSASASSLQPVILTTANPSTARPAFQLTIEPEDSEEYPDQEPYSSVNQPSVANKDLEQSVEESKFSAKFVEKPSNFNYIVSGEKTVSTTDKYSETEISSTTITNNDERTEESGVSTTVKPVEDDEEEIESATTDLSVTTTEVVPEKTKSRRRGAWRLVRTRPVVDEFESAESQNVESVFNNNDFTVADKPIRKYKVVQRIRTTTEPFKIETTTPSIAETTLRPQEETTTYKYHDLSDSKSSILAPLLEMFGYNSNQSLDPEETVDSTTENFNTLPEDIGTTLLPNNTTEIPALIIGDENPSFLDDSWKSRVIGTSTTTEISHETEICYRGRCIKSASTEEDSEASV